VNSIRSCSESTQRKFKAYDFELWSDNRESTCASNPSPDFDITLEFEVTSSGMML
ncbi:hypothetical protein AVEN_89311-1, partial [Araneus ventricosus]